MYNVQDNSVLYCNAVQSFVYEAWNWKTLAWPCHIINRRVLGSYINLIPPLLFGSVSTRNMVSQTCCLGIDFSSASITINIGFWNGNNIIVFVVFILFGNRSRTNYCSCSSYTYRGVFKDEWIIVLLLNVKRTTFQLCHD